MVLLHQFKVHNIFTDEKKFYLNSPVSYQKESSLGPWARGKKTDVKSVRLLIEHEKFAQHVMMSAGVFWE